MLRDKLNANAEIAGWTPPVLQTISVATAVEARADTSSLTAIEVISVATAEEIEAISVETAEEIEAISVATAEEIKAISVETADEIEALSVATADEIEAVSVATAEEIEAISVETADEIEAISVETADEIGDGLATISAATVVESQLVDEGDSQSQLAPTLSRFFGDVPPARIEA